MRLAALGSTVQRAASPTYSTARGGLGALRRRVVAGVLVALSLTLITGYFRESDNGALHGVQGVAASICARSRSACRARRAAVPGRLRLGRRLLPRKIRERDAERTAASAPTAGDPKHDRRTGEPWSSSNALKFRSGPSIRAATNQVAAEVTSYDPNRVPGRAGDLGRAQRRGPPQRSCHQQPRDPRRTHLQDESSRPPRSRSSPTATSPSPAYDVYTGTYGLVSHGQGAGETLILDLVPKDKLVRRERPDRDSRPAGSRRLRASPSLWWESARPRNWNRRGFSSLNVGSD